MPDVPRLIVGVAGRIGSGKSEVARYLADRFGFQYLRYSLVLAAWFDIDPEEKQRLQRIGWSVMSSEGQYELNRRLIAEIDPDRDCVVDGLRHPIDFDSLRDKFRSRFFLIYVDTPPDVRFERLRSRYSSYEAFRAADEHPVESKIDLLIPLASAVVSGGMSPEQLGAEITGLVSKFRSGASL